MPIKCQVFRLYLPHYLLCHAFFQNGLVNLVSSSKNHICHCDHHHHHCRHQPHHPHYPHHQHHCHHLYHSLHCHYSRLQILISCPIFCQHYCNCILYKQRSFKQYLTIFAVENIFSPVKIQGALKFTVWLSTLGLYRVTAPQK